MDGSVSPNERTNVGRRTIMSQSDSTELPPGTVESSSASVPATPRTALQSNAGSCPTCGQTARSAAIGQYVYAVGQVEARFPTLSVEKEFAQAVGRAETAGLADRAALQKVLSQHENRYLVRELCWVLTNRGLDTYVLFPSDRADSHLLVESLRPAAKPDALDVVIGVRGPIAPPEMCGGLTIPTLIFDQIYSFDRDALLKAIPRPEGIKSADFAQAADGLLDRIMQVADNTGATSEHRALNYLAVRYPAIYANAADASARNATLTRVETTGSRLSGVRNVVDVIFSYTNRNTDVVEKYFVRVDVTEKYPFLVTKLSPYYDR